MKDEVNREVDRILHHLRAKIREQEHTQLSVQKELGWGRSYISQLLTRQKALRVEQVLAILDVIGVSPADFYAEVYRSPGSGLGRPLSEPISELADGGAAPYDGEAVARSVADFRDLVGGLIDHLAERGLVDLGDLRRAVSRRKGRGLDLVWSEGEA